MFRHRRSVSFSVPLEGITVYGNGGPPDTFSALFHSMGCDMPDYKSFTDWYRTFISEKIHELPPVIAGALPSPSPSPSRREEESHTAGRASGEGGEDSATLGESDETAGGHGAEEGSKPEWIRDCLLKCLVCMVDTLRTKETLHFAEMEEILRENHLVRENIRGTDTRIRSNGSNDHHNLTGIGSDTDSASASDSVSKLVLFAFRLLTFLLEPTRFGDDGHDHLPPAARGHSYGRLQRSMYDVPMAKYREMSLDLVVRGFNDRTPLVTRAKSSSHHRATRQQEALSSLNINYYTLSKLANITVAWTETATRHLELDARNKILYLFCYPSFCALMCGPSQQQVDDDRLGSWPIEPNGCFLDRLFQQVQQPSSEPTSPYPTSPHGSTSERSQVTAAQFYKEILATYRVIFGQDNKSSKAYRRRKDSKAVAWIKKLLRCMSKEQPTDPGDTVIVEDALVEELCGKNWQKQTVYSHIDLDPVKVTYQAAEEFPFFFHRLLEIQDFVATQEPDGWAALWHDRRDMGRYWTFWAVIYFSILTLVIGLWQVGLAFAQVFQSSGGS